MQHESCMVGGSTECMVSSGTKGNIHLQDIVKP